MYLQHWKFEIKKDKETGRFCVRDLSIDKGRYGGVRIGFVRRLRDVLP